MVACSTDILRVMASLFTLIGLKHPFKKFHNIYVFKDIEKNIIYDVWFRFMFL